MYQIAIKYNYLLREARTFQINQGVQLAKDLKENPRKWRANTSHDETVILDDDRILLKVEIETAQCECHFTLSE